MFRLINKDTIALKENQIKNNLVDLKDALESDLEQLGFLDGEHYDIEFDAKAGILLITSNEVKILNCIGNVLKDAGQNYWDQAQLANANMFFFKPKREKAQPISNNNSNILEPEEYNNIICAMQ